MLKRNIIEYRVSVGNIGAIKKISQHYEMPGKYALFLRENTFNRDQLEDNTDVKLSRQEF